MLFTSEMIAKLKALHTQHGEALEKYHDIVNDEGFEGQYDSEEGEKDGIVQGYLECLGDFIAILEGKSNLGVLNPAAIELLRIMEEEG